MTLEIENMYTLLSIDAWHDGDGWYWNNQFKIEEDIYIEENISNRKLLAWMRARGWLTEKSKGMLTVNSCADPDIEIINRKTQEPIFAFRPQWSI